LASSNMPYRSWSHQRAGRVTRHAGSPNTFPTSTYLAVVALTGSLHLACNKADTPTNLTRHKNASTATTHQELTSHQPESETLQPEENGVAENFATIEINLELTQSTHLASQIQRGLSSADVLCSCYLDWKKQATGSREIFHFLLNNETLLVRDTFPLRHQERASHCLQRSIRSGLRVIPMMPPTIIIGLHSATNGFKLRSETGVDRMLAPTTDSRHLQVEELVWENTDIAAHIGFQYAQNKQTPCQISFGYTMPINQH
jgi:hypothetical protein